LFFEEGEIEQDMNLTGPGGADDGEHAEKQPLKGF